MKSPVLRKIGRAFRTAGQRLWRGLPFGNPYLTLSNWEYQRKVIEPRLSQDSVILDIGSGHFPCPRASVLADFFPDETIHRTAAIVEDRPLVVCSIERLPFLPGAFDFAICSHVLEHVESPRRGAAELARVARAGYIETPAYGKDVIVGTGSMHRWQVVEFEGEMFFFEYSKRQKEANVTSPVMEIWTSPRRHPWQDFFWERMDVFNAWLLWTGPPKVTEHRRAGRDAQPAPLPAWRPVRLEEIRGGESTLSTAEIELLGRRLATPDGQRPMRFASGSFASEDGAVVYPVRGKRVYCELPAPGQ